MLNIKYKWTPIFLPNVVRIGYLNHMIWIKSLKQFMKSGKVSDRYARTHLSSLFYVNYF